jgi:hypothetical protein
MPTFDALLTYPLTPSEVVLLNGQGFSPRAGLGDRLQLMSSDVVVSASILVRTMLAVAFLADEQAGSLRLDARNRDTPFGPSKVPTLYVEPDAAAAAFPASTLEARLPGLATGLRASRAHEAGAVVHAWLGADTPVPWQQAATLVQRGLAGRGLLETTEVVKFGFVKTQEYRLSASTAELAAQGPVALVRQLLQECAERRPEVWARLGDQIDGGLRRRLAAAPAAPTRRPLDDDE